MTMNDLNDIIKEQNDIAQGKLIIKIYNIIWIMIQVVFLILKFTVCNDWSWIIILLPSIVLGGLKGILHLIAYTRFYREL